jgi:uncharacterized protein (DUF1800 family)
MKTFTFAAAVAFTLMVPVLSFAANHREVHAQVLQAGPQGTLQQSKDRHAVTQPANASPSDSAYGSSQDGSAQSGRFAHSPMPIMDHSLFSHH